MLGGVKTFLEGSADDLYFQTIETQASELDDLAAFVSRYVPSSSTVLDVGANIGLSAILLSRLVHRVIAYEPSPPNIAFLRRNLALNGVTNVEVRPVAVSDKPGTLRFQVARFGAGSHVVSADHLAAATVPTVDVLAIALDDEAHPPIAFIKMDAEGCEPEALAGARLLLARDRPLIYMEINTWCLSAFAGHNLGTLVRTLWRAFDVGKPEPGGTVSQLPDPLDFLHSLIVDLRGTTDIILRPCGGMQMPTLRELTWPESALAALCDAAAPGAARLERHQRSDALAAPAHDRVTTETTSRPE